jgi:hypothetical protein
MDGHNVERSVIRSMRCEIRGEMGGILRKLEERVNRSFLQSSVVCLGYSVDY